jgi:TolA-binding protein
MAAFWLFMGLMATPTVSATEPCITGKPGIQIRTSTADIQAKRWDVALDCIIEDPSPEWSGHFSALRGMVYTQTARAPDAVVAFQAALDDPHVLAPLRDVVRFRLGQALSQIEDHEGALTALDGLLVGDMQRAGRLPKPRGVDPAALRWALAEVQQHLGKHQAAIETLKALWTRNPTSALSDAAAAQLQTWGAAIDPATSAGQALIQTRMRTLEKLYRPQEALALREQLPATHSARGAHTFAAAVFKAKDYSRAATLLAALTVRSPDESVLLALAYVRSGDPQSSIQTYRNLSKGTGPVAEISTYKIGYMAFDQQDWPTAIATLRNYLDQFPGGRHTESALWFTGMAQLRRGEMASANESFQRIELDHPASSMRPGAVYWQALTGPDSMREAGLEKVVRLWPETGYAWFASHALGKTFPLKVDDSPTTADIIIDHPDWRIGTTLSQAGQDAWARPHLERLARSAGTLARAQRIALANALIKAGSYRSGKGLVRQWCGKPTAASDLSLIGACWPRPNAERVQGMALDAGLPAYLPFAIMTAESALDPGVTSPAGARGLMQLMPALAEVLHQQLWPDQPFDADKMYAPAYNAELGTTELSHLAERFADVGVIDPLPMVIAGYNGGAEAVERWVKHYQAQPGSALTDWNARPKPDVWAEFIGYSETRKYVRRVLGHLQTYRLAYGDQPDQAPGSSSIGTKAKGSPGDE